MNLSLKKKKLYYLETIYFNIRVMVFNATFNNISVISWQSVLLVEETVIPGSEDCRCFDNNLW
jgi:hypothetical protein